jgi:excisionase family DNA binding protein
VKPDRVPLEPLLSVEQVLGLTQLSRKRVLKAVRRGELVAARFGNRLRFRPDALRAWLERAEGGKR